jgi:hypothetical protein
MMQESRPRSPSSSTALIPDSECDDRAKKRKVRGSLIAQFGGHDPFYMGHAAALIKQYMFLIISRRGYYFAILIDCELLGT